MQNNYVRRSRPQIGRLRSPVLKIESSNKACVRKHFRMLKPHLKSELWEIFRLTNVPCFIFHLTHKKSLWQKMSAHKSAFVTDLPVMCAAWPSSIGPTLITTWPRTTRSGGATSAANCCPASVTSTFTWRGSTAWQSWRMRAAFAARDLPRSRS